MKNLYNVGFVALLLVVLGCNCQRFQNLSDQSKTPTGSSSPTASTSPAATSSPADSDKKTALTLDKFNQIKDGMSYKEVVGIIGSEGKQVATMGEGKTKFESYKWDGEDFQYILISFVGEKMFKKDQDGLK